MDTQNKAEKKVRKAMEKVNLKPVENVAVVTMRKNPGGQILNIFNPQVYKAAGSSGSETYLVYGKFGGENQRPLGGAQAFGEEAPSADDEAAGNAGADEAVQGSKSGASLSGKAERDASGNFSDQEIQMVMSQANADRKRAVEALERNDGDIVNAIMDLSMEMS